MTSDSGGRDANAPSGAPAVRAAPFADAYWLRGVDVAAGEYPGALREEDALKKVRALLDAGVRRFIDLTGEGELLPYRHLVEREAAARGIDVTHVRLPIPDMGVPAAERMAEILDALDAAVAAGEPAYVHCWGGVGRTGTVVGCWLVHRGLACDDALAEVKRLFATTSASKQRNHPEGSPQTRAQREFVRAWRPRKRADGP
jgi:hypothetical protein